MHDNPYVPPRAESPLHQPAAVSRRRTCWLDSILGFVGCSIALVIFLRDPLCLIVTAIVFRATHVIKPIRVSRLTRVSIIAASGAIGGFISGALYLSTHQILRDRTPDVATAISTVLLGFPMLFGAIGAILGLLVARIADEPIETSQA